MSKLVLIDGNAIMHRAYHAMPPLTTPDDEPIGAVHGFLNIFLKLLDELEPTHLAVCWDRKEPTFRKKKYKDYQAHRPPTEKELSSQFPKIRKVLDTFKVSQFDEKGFEADDLIGTISKQSKTDEVVIVTGDKDQLQLVDDRIKVFLPKRGLSNGELYGPNKVKKKLGVEPGKVVDLKAFMGDQSDNYPGIYGIGPKTAEKLLNDYGTFENVFKNIDKIKGNLRKKLEEGKDDGEISKDLAKIITDMDIDYNENDLKNWEIGSEDSVELFQKYGFRSLTRRIQGKKIKRINNSPKEKDIKKVIEQLATLLKGENYVIRGTASLLLQEFDMGVDDIDVLTDKKSALKCNKLLKKYRYEEVDYKESDKYRSYFGKFVIDKILVEVYGEWEIKGAKDNKWSKKFIPIKEITNLIDVNGKKVKVTTVEHELNVFALEGRWNAFHKLKKQVEEKNQGKLF